MLKTALVVIAALNKRMPLTFFLDCLLYAIERQNVITTSQQFSDQTLNLFLYGHPVLTLQQNHKVFLAVYLYFEQTKSFV